MEPIGNLANRAVQTSSTRPAPTRLPDLKQRLPEQLTSQLFIRLRSIYGHRWTSLFTSAEQATAMKAEWSLALGGFTDQVIEKALESSAREYVDFPPTLPQFMALCRMHEPRKVYQALPGPEPSTREFALGKLAELKELLAKKAKVDKQRPARQPMDPLLWRAKFIAELTAHGVSEKTAEEAYQAALPYCDLTTDPKTSADVILQFNPGLA